MRYFFRSKSFRQAGKRKEQPIFGVPLSVAVERSKCHDGVDVPLVVRECIDHIQEVGLNSDGLYKMSGKSKAQNLCRLYNQRETINLADYDLPVSTSLLKIFLKELPEPLLTSELLVKFEEAGAVKESSARSAELKTLVENLPSCNRQLLGWLIRHFESVVAHEKSNKMNSHTLASTMSPALQASPKLILALLSQCDIIFPDCKLTKYIPPLSCGSPSLPETKEEITKELCKQESLLGQLHSEVQAGICTKDREEQLWEVQRIITQLKRKLRVLERSAESAQRSMEEPDCGRVTQEDELNLSMQQQQSPNSHPIVVQAIVEKQDEPVSEPSDTQAEAEKLWQAKKEEMAIVFETEELVSLAKSLQALIESEKAEVVLLKNKIKALGATPVTCGLLLEDAAHDSSSEAVRETALLQGQKEALATALIEERFTCVDLNVQLRLAQMAKG